MNYIMLDERNAIIPLFTLRGPKCCLLLAFARRAAEAVEASSRSVGGVGVADRGTSRGPRLPRRACRRPRPPPPITSPSFASISTI